ncbi:MAG: hypothetical protein H6818_20675 [Phycisphaerales bacterium]|nr:hypothetical protein [Phycisphaerales bacterium]
MIGASIVGLGLVEGILRLVWTPPAGDRVIHSFDFEKALQRDAELGYVPRANVTVEYPPYGAIFATNSAGIRGPEQSVEREIGRRRIMVLGDSFAWGHGVSTGEAFPEVIGATLPDADVINLGVPGYDLAKSLAFYRRIGRAYQPDLVIVSICQNDIRSDGIVATSTDSARQTARSVESDGAAAAPMSRSIKQWLHAHSRLYLLLQQTINTNKSLSRLAVTIGLKEDLAGFEMLDDNLRPALIAAPDVVRRSRVRTCEQLRAIRDALSDDGADMLVALIPCIQAIDQKELEKSIAYTTYESSDFDLGAPMKMLADCCVAAGIQVVDPTADFKAAVNRGERLYLPGDLHFNAAGHALFAHCILDAMASKPLTSDRTVSSADRSKATPPRSSR